MSEYTIPPPYAPRRYLLASNVNVDSVITLVLPHSKTNQFGRPLTVIIGATGSSICPVRVMKKYLAARQRYPAGPLFMLEDGSWLSRQNISALYLGKAVFPLYHPRVQASGLATAYRLQAAYVGKAVSPLYHQFIPCTCPSLPLATVSNGGWVEQPLSLWCHLPRHFGPYQFGGWLIWGVSLGLAYLGRGLPRPGLT